MWLFSCVIWPLLFFPAVYEVLSAQSLRYLVISVGFFFRLWLLILYHLLINQENQLKATMWISISWFTYSATAQNTKWWKRLDRNGMRFLLVSFKVWYDPCFNRLQICLSAWSGTRRIKNVCLIHYLSTVLVCKSVSRVGIKFSSSLEEIVEKDTAVVFQSMIVHFGSAL